MHVVVSKDAVFQGHLLDQLQRLFPQENIATNVRKEGPLSTTTTEYPLEIDVWLPSLNICFEYQDSHHYITTWYSHSPLSVIRRVDSEKRETVAERGETLMVIPCWWDGALESLAATILFHRPDLAEAIHPNYLECAHSIDLNPSYDSFKSFGVPGIGELMAASFPAVSQAFINAIDEEHYWWLGEKYDGVRGCWNVREKQLYSRYGMQLSVPATITKGFPMTVCFDCEVWFGRGVFSDAQRIITADSMLVDWPFLRLVSFDVLQHDLLPFEKRYSKLLSEISAHLIPIILAPRVRCKSKKHLTYSLRSMLDFGGEGVILRRPQSTYFHGRSSELIKLKASRGDMEALVLKVKRRFMKLMLADGNVLNVPTENMRCAPKIGDVVSFSYEQTAKRAMPANVKVYRIRKDLNWELVLHNHRKENSALTLGAASHVVAGMTLSTTSYEGVENKRQMRKMLEDFARSHNLNPLLAKTWYRLSNHFHLIKRIERLNTWLQKYFHGSVVKALLLLFPEVMLVESKFAIAPRNYWGQVSNRRAFLETYASEHRFDPLIAANWYSSYGDTFRLYKGGEGILSYYDGDYVRAILHLFPEIGLADKKLSRRYWLEKKNQQNVLVEFAAALGINPLVADSWYSVNPDLFYSSKTVAPILRYYEGSHTKALMHLFPDIGLDERHFNNYWADYLHRKHLFVEYSIAAGFQPHDPVMWESTNLVNILTLKGVSATLRFYDGNLIRALVDLFPNIGLDESKLRKKYHEDLESLRAIFAAFAKESGFDHRNPKHWYEADLTTVPIELKDSSLYNRRLKCIKLLFQALPNIGLDKLKFGIGLGKLEADVKARRLFFTLFAKEKGFDPLVPENWYSVPTDEFLAIKGGRSVVTRYGGSFPKALMHLFPNIGLLRTKFSQRPLKFWRDLENKRQFFIGIAKAKGFDPLVAANWYAVTLQDVLDFKGSRSILPQYDGSFVRALQTLFDFELDQSKFVSSENKNQIDVGQRRLFFDQFAKDYNFDPLEPSNWYHVTLRSLLAKEGSDRVIQQYDGNVIEALQHVYPELEINHSRFVTLNPNHWLRVENRIAFFMEFAKDLGFDPLIADNWHSLDYQALMRYKCAPDLLPDRPSVAKNLLHLFPNIGLDRTKFKFVSRGYWIVDELQHKRNLFLEFAKEKRFDPLVPNNWYLVSEEDVLSYKHAREIISYKRSFAHGLLAVFPDIGLDPARFTFTSQDSKLAFVPSKHWLDATNQRHIFVKFALQHPHPHPHPHPAGGSSSSSGGGAFDPLVPSNWYPITFQQMKAMKGIRAVREQHKTLPIALQVAFPEVAFDFERFMKMKTRRRGQDKLGDDHGSRT